MTHSKLLLINVDMVSPNIICEHHGVDWPAADIWNYEKFKQLNVEILQISADTGPSLKAWAESLGGIPFPLLSDYWPHGAIGQAYGVFNGERGMNAPRRGPGRVRSQLDRGILDATPGGRQEPADAEVHEPRREGDPGREGLTRTRPSRVARRGLTHVRRPAFGSRGVQARQGAGFLHQDPLASTMR